MNRGPLRVLHLPSTVAGNAWGLAQGERKLGIDAKVLIEKQRRYNYRCDICLNLQSKNKMEDVWTRLSTFMKIRHHYDVFHFNAGSSLIDFISYGFHLKDLPFYPKDRKIVFTFNGCDARQKFPTMQRVSFSACHNDQCYDGICNTGGLDDKRRKRIEIVSRYSRHIFSLNPDLMYFLPCEASFLPYSIAGWGDIHSVHYQIDKPFRIVHSPTNRSAKGSSLIIEAVEHLKKKYPYIEMILIEDLPYEKALKIYERANLVIDQVLIGWYGAVGVETMKMGKPLAVFIRDQDLKFIPKQMADDLRESIININPSNIEQVLECYIQNPDLLIQKSAAGLEYVHKWHAPEYVAGITKAVYESLD